MSTSLSFCLFVLVLVPTARGADQPVRIDETQLTLRLDPVQGRATVIGIADETLTVLTAAHFFTGDDVGRTIRIQQERPLSGRVLSVARNPLFRPLRSRRADEPSAFGTLGVDTAIATLKVDLREGADREVFEKIRVVELTMRYIPGAPDQILTVHIVDQSGKEHVVRAGNHLNPKCLAWGRNSYDTQRGDSGAGIFLMRKTPEEGTIPVLIGNVSQTDDRGGIASLAARNDPWIEKALEGR